jgi:hypothetical protein
MKKQTTRRKKAVGNPSGMIDFNFDNVAYQIDPTRHKVYHHWVEVATAKTFLIMGAYNQAHIDKAV